MNEEIHNFTNNETTLLYQRIINVENQLAKLEREFKSQIDYLNQQNQDILQTTDSQHNWLQLLDKAVKELREGKQDKIIVNITTPKITPVAKFNWKFW